MIDNRRVSTVCVPSVSLLTESAKADWACIRCAQQKSMTMAMRTQFRMLDTFIRWKNIEKTNARSNQKSFSSRLKVRRCEKHSVVFAQFFSDIVHEQFIAEQTIHCRTAPRHLREFSPRNIQGLFYTSHRFVCS